MVLAAPPVMFPEIVVGVADVSFGATPVLKRMPDPALPKIELCSTGTLAEKYSIPVPLPA